MALQRRRERHGTAAEWTSANPVLGAGEIGVEVPGFRFKFGDGVTAWSSLDYAAGEGAMSAAEILTALLTVDGTGSLLNADLLDGVQAAGFETVGAAAAVGVTAAADATTKANAAIVTAAADATSKVATHEADTTSVHGITNTALLETATGAQAKVDTHVNDTSAAHAASAVAFTPAGTIAGSDVQTAVAEVATDAAAALTTHTGAADPHADRAYTDAQIAANLSTAFDFKAAVRVATTANITLSGAQTIDGVSVVATDRVLVKDQSTGSQNGIYVAASGAWSRATDADISAEVTAGMAVPVTEGTIGGGQVYLLTTPNPITLATTALSFSAIGSGDLLSTNNLSDLTSASAARTNLGLGTVATTAASAYATAAQGVTAGTAVQPARSISTTAPLTGGGDLSANRTLAVSAATATTTGVVELATDAETLTGTDTTRATTPANITAALATVTIVDATETVKGKVELATVAEATTGTDTTRATTAAGVAAAIAANNADVTGADVEAAGAVMEADTTTTLMQFVIDEDSFASNLATKVPTQQSVKAYVLANVSGSLRTTNPQTGTAYTFVLGDDGNLVTADNTSAQTYTIPTNATAAIPVHGVLCLLSVNTGVVTVVGDTGVTVHPPPGYSLALAGQYAIAVFEKIATNEWIAAGRFTRSTGLAIAEGGTGGTTQAAARTALDVPSNAQAILDVIIDAAGDLIVGNSADTPTRMAVGTNAQVLTVDTSLGIKLKWATPGTGAVATDAIFDAKGDIAVATAADTAIRLPVGTNNHVLTADSAQTAGVKWAAAGSGSVASDTIFDAKGDLAAGTAADTAAKLTVGADGLVLMADSTQTTGLAWKGIYFTRKTGAVEWYMPDATPTATVVATQSKLYYLPLRVVQNYTIDRVAINVTTLAASSSGRLGLYTSVNGRPAARLQDTGAAAVDTTATGDKTATVSWAMTPGLYWLAVVFQGGAPTVRGCSYATDISSIVGSTLSELTAATPIMNWGETGITSTLPDPATPVPSNNVNVPRVLIRIT